MGRVKFSIVIALAPERDAEVIRTLKRQDYPPEDYEIIIKRGSNASENRNNGIKESVGDIIAFVDDDAVLEDDWLKKAANFFLKYPEIDVVGGPQLTPHDDTAFGHASGAAFASILGGASIRNRYRKGRLNLNSDERELTTANLFCRKSVLDKVLFDTRFWPGEDPVFFNELALLGLKIAYSPQLYIYHRRRNSVSQLSQQVFRYGYVRPKIRNTGKAGRTALLFLAPALFSLYLVSLPALLYIDRSFLLPLVVYVLASIAVSSVIAAKEGKCMHLVLLPFIFLIIHLSYGVGYLCGFFYRKLKCRNQIV